MTAFKNIKVGIIGAGYVGLPLAASFAKHLSVKVYDINLERITHLKNDISNLDLVGEIRHKGMVMGIELVQNKNSNKPLSSKTSINKLVFDEGRKHQIYFRTLGNIIMLVPPLAISQKDLNFLIDGTISTIKSISRKL